VPLAVPVAVLLEDAARSAGTSVTACRRGDPSSRAAARRRARVARRSCRDRLIVPRSRAGNRRDGIPPACRSPLPPVCGDLSSPSVHVRRLAPSSQVLPKRSSCTSGTASRIRRPTRPPWRRAAYRLRPDQTRTATYDGCGAGLRALGRHARQEYRSIGVTSARPTVRPRRPRALAASPRRRR
jgi:hypothetical protein